MRPDFGTDGRLPSALSMGTADVAFHLATGGNPVPLAFTFGFEGRAPTLDSVRARVAERVHQVPALRYRIARDRRKFRRVDRIAVDRHVHEAWLPEDTDGSATSRLMLSRPMSTDDRPPWDVWLVHGPAERHTLVYRTDHTFQDGMGAAYTARALLGDHPEGGPAPQRPARPTAHGLADALGEVVAAFRAPTPKPAFDGDFTGRVDVCHADTPLARLRAIARAHGGTVTDVYLAALSHAVRTWYLKDTGSAHPPLPVSIPMSVRAPGEEYAPGNRMVTARLLLPCDEESPQRALARVVAGTGRLRESRRRDAMRLLLSASPRALGATVGTRLVRGAFVAGPVSSVNFGTALVHQGVAARRSAVFAGVASGIRCVTTLTSQHDTACLTVVHDEALATADELPDLWLAALLELERPCQGVPRSVPVVRKTLSAAAVPISGRYGERRSTAYGSVYGSAAAASQPCSAHQRSGSAICQFQPSPIVDRASMKGATNGEDVVAEFTHSAPNMLPGAESSVITATTAATSGGRRKYRGASQSHAVGLPGSNPAAPSSSPQDAVPSASTTVRRPQESRLQSSTYSLKASTAASSTSKTCTPVGQSSRKARVSRPAPSSTTWRQPERAAARA